MYFIHYGVCSRSLIVSVKEIFFRIFLVVIFFSFYFLTELQSDKNIFMPANINSIVLIVDLRPFLAARCIPFAY